MSDGLKISDGYSRLVLARIGEPDRQYPADCYPTRITLTSGPFSASVDALSHPIPGFIASLKALHKSLKGRSRLEFWSEAHAVTISGNACGGIIVSVEIVDDLRGRLTVPIFLDQSYLPQVIAEITDHFLC